MLSVSMYPIELPKMKFQEGLDFLLLELPPRYIPMMPNGVAHVATILKGIDVKFQVFDANIILYHRFHSQRILNNLNHVITDTGFVLPTNPWSITYADDWEDNDEILNHFSGFIDKIILEIIKARPKIVGFSLNGNNTKFTQRIIESIRACLPDCTVIVGGYMCVFHEIGPRVIGDYDYMIIGEAEASLPGLVQDILARKDPSDVPGVLSRFDSEGREFEAAPLFRELDTIEFPKYEWLDYGLYTGYDGYRLVPVSGSRGCVWAKCTFCSERFQWRRRSPQSIVDEFEWHAKRGANLFQFNESDLNGDPDSLVLLCEEVVRRGLLIRFMGQLRIHRKSDKAFFSVLRGAGFTSLRFGVDGWSRNTNRIQRKGYPISLIEDNLKACHQAGINVTVNIVLCVPGETEEDVSETIERIVSNQEHITVVEGLNILILAYGNDFYKDPDKYNIKFVGDKEEIYQKYPRAIPGHLWYWEKDGVVVNHNDRIGRLQRVADALSGIGLYVSPYANKRVEISMAEPQKLEDGVGGKCLQITQKDSLKERFNRIFQEKTVIYGTGIISQRIFDLVENKENIIFTDSNEYIWDTLLYNIRIIPNTDILKFSKRVIIASDAFADEIRTTLQGIYGETVDILLPGDI